MACHRVPASLVDEGEIKWKRNERHSGLEIQMSFASAGMLVKQSAGWLFV